MDRCIYSAMWILDLMAGRVLIWRTDTWLCQFDSLTLHRWNVQQVFQPESARLFYNVPIQGFDISIWRVGGFPFQAAAQPYRVSPVIGQPGSPCKTAVEPTFCGTKFLVLAIWLRDLFFLSFIPILYPFWPPHLCHLATLFRILCSKGWVWSNQKDQNTVSTKPQWFHNS